MEHYSVMAREALDGLAIRPEGRYADVTTGLGGHSALIAERLESGVLAACDRDSESLDQSRANTQAQAARIRYIQARFSELPQRLAAEGLLPLDGLLADLGVSRYQLTNPDRGFSLLAAGPLDMRMDRVTPGGNTASEIVNTTAESTLADLIYQLGGERRSRKIARAIVRARPIRDTHHLASVVEQVVPRTGRLHPATQTFMALRLAVNEEPEELKALLESLPALMAAGSRVVVITFMSDEDRQVKRAFQALARSGNVRLINKHVITPGRDEVVANPPSRSAKMRILEFV